jgi:hypothetical protein
MGASRPVPWPVADITIRELYGLEKLVPATARSERASVLLSHESFRRQFEELSPDKYLGGAAAASYLGISQLGIERKLAEAFSTSDTSWRTALALDPGHSQRAALVDARFRWSFVQDELEPLLGAEQARTRRRREQIAARKPGIRGDAMKLPLGHTCDGQQYVLNRHGVILAALGQGAITAEVFVDTMNDGGSIVRLDPIIALGKPWLNLDARGAWDRAVREVVEVQARTILARLDEGARATAALGHSPQAVTVEVN